MAGDARGGGASEKDMSHTLTHCSRPTHMKQAKKHSTGTCGSRVGLSITEPGGNGRQWPVLLLRWAVSAHMPLKLVFQIKTPQFFL